MGHTRNRHADLLEKLPKSRLGSAKRVASALLVKIDVDFYLERYGIQLEKDEVGLYNGINYTRTTLSSQPAEFSKILFRKIRKFGLH